MASLNLSTNGPSIKSSYQAVINGPAPSSSSPTFAQWALFSVSAPLANAFQDTGSKESVLKVQSTGEGELEELIEDFSEGRIQFAFVKVKDPNSGLPKYALIAWCGGGVPERTKGYFTTHTAAVSKILHGYHVQITARSDSDLEPESIVKKIADASGAKYSAGSSGGASSSPAPPVATKPVFTPTSSSNINPIVAARNRRGGNTDDDGWGDDAPPVTRSQLEKVESSYKPTKVNMAELTGQKQEPSRFQPAAQQDEDRRGVIGGGYQPVGKIDIAAIRAASKTQADDRPTTVKGAYEPVGKVDIAAIRAKAQKPPANAPEPEPEAEGEPERPKSLAERSAAFSQSSSERITSLPKPKVANKFGGSSFSGTKAPTPSGGLGLHGPVSTPVAQVGSAGRSFASSAGKSPAQLWAEKKAKEGGNAPPPAALGVQRSGTDAAPIGIQKSGEWKSGYSGKSWGPVQTGDYGRGIPGQVSQDNTGDDQSRSAEAPAAEPASPGGVGALRDRFKNTAPIGIGAPPIPQPSQDEPEPEPQHEEEPEPSPPPPPSNTRPSGGFALPGLPARPPSPTEEPEPEPTPPPPPAQRPAEPQQSQSYQQDYDDEPEHSPVRVPVPVARGQETEITPPSPPPTIPTQEIERQIPREEDIPDEPRDAGRGASTILAEQEFGQQQVQAAQAQPGGQAGGKRAVIQYDYEAAEDNEIDLREGDEVTNIDMVDEDWWMGTNAQGRSGLFPSNYVELVKEESSAPAGRAMPPPPAPAQAEPTPAPAPAAPAGGQGKTATALFDYEAAEDNELSFNENDKITNIEFPDEDWWFGQFRGKQGLFPANYVELDR